MALDPLDPLDLILGQRAAVVLLHAGVAVCAASILGDAWLARASSAWSQLRRRRLARWAAAGAFLALLAQLAVLWLQAAAMAEVPLLEAGGAVSDVLARSRYGKGWAIGALALALALVLSVVLMRAATRGRARLFALVPLCVFWYVRCLNSHASQEGDFSPFMLAYAAHLGLISLWLGEVLVAGLAVLAGGAAQADERVRGDRLGYVRSLSDSATLSLAGIFATGLYLAWHILRGPADLLGDPYGRTLLAKLALVGLAAAMGGFNRFFVMPGLDGPGRDAAAARLRLVLRWEGLVLLAVLALATVLASSAPPGSGM